MRMLATVVALLALVPAPAVVAQDPALIEAVAPILMAEDRRVLDLTVLGPALEHPDATVRRVAVTAVGRIGAADGVLLLAERLRDRDPIVVADAFFALGLLRDARAVPLIHDRLRLDDSLSRPALDEAATALARIGGADAARILADAIAGSGDLRRDRSDGLRSMALLESWRLGALAPVNALLPFTRDTGADLRWRAHYTLGRLFAPSASAAMLAALRDRASEVREVATRTLTRRYADSAGLTQATVVPELVRMLDDEQDGVRVAALGALASWRDSSAAPRAAGLLRDADRNVRIAAANALANLGGPDARQAVAATLDARNEAWGVRRAALAALARLDPAAFAARIGAWTASNDVFDRIAGVESWGIIRGADPAPFRRALVDTDPRVRAAALGAWRASAGAADTAVRAAARSAWSDGDPQVRAAALPVLADSASEAVLDLLTTAWQGTDPDLREAALTALIRVSRGERSFLTQLTAANRRLWLDRPADPVLRGMAARGFAALSARWGGVGPFETGRTLQDYRELAGRFLLARDNPRVALNLESRGRVEIELLGRDAPLTVANFLRLVDRRYFDNGRWHRVVPNFVVQDGDPTGTGSGGPGWSIRDEINRLRYGRPMLGMALSGPNTGGSQWFINLSPQPHLDGGYTIFGRVVSGFPALGRIIQGDPIRSIERVTTP